MAGTAKAMIAAAIINERFILVFSPHAPVRRLDVTVALSS
jgi:hypothetical protein